MMIGLIIILIVTLLLPFLVKRVEENLEVFLFVMGLATAIVSGVLSKDLISHISHNTFLYLITGAVLIVSIVFKFFKNKIKTIVNFALNHMSIKVFTFIMILFLGVISSLITAIVASLILVEIISVMPIKRKNKVNLSIISCFSIGIGSSLTPIGEPIATIVVSKLNENFGFLFKQIGVPAIIGVLLLGILGAFIAGSSFDDKNSKNITKKENANMPVEDKEEETYKDIAFRTIKIFIFVIALELLGSGFKPLIDTYVIGLDSRLLYWGNIISAVLDNATIAAAEISPNMNLFQIRALLMGLLISGGMLIPGNIPNIITAGKLKISSSEWVKVGVPLGLVMLVGYYLVLFVV